MRELRRLLEALAALAVLRGANHLADRVDRLLGDPFVDGGPVSFAKGGLVNEQIEFPELMPRPTLESIEADCRRKMAAIATMQSRGFDSARLRDAAIRQLDDNLDLYNLAQALED